MERQRQVAFIINQFGDVDFDITKKRGGPSRFGVGRQDSARGPGILLSGIHWSWFIATCSKLKGDFRYTPESVFDTFPGPQKPKHEDIKAVAEAAVTLRALRQETMRKLNYSLPPRAIFRLVFSV
jgi:hypothetical protein